MYSILVFLCSTIASFQFFGSSALNLPIPWNNEVCFDGLGCLNNNNPWFSFLRPVPMPQSPEKCPTTILYYSRRNIDSPYKIKPYPKANIDDIPFDSQKPTVFVSHGFLRDATTNWMHEFKDVYLENMDANVFLISWKTGLLDTYRQSVANIRQVAMVLSSFLQLLADTKGLKPESVHLVGHSLGAHICAYIAKAIPGIGRLTALDPAQPGFEGLDAKIRLDKSDAAFVEVLHTDFKPFIPMMGYGMMAPHGHVDFYFNGGMVQPGCILPDKYPNITKLSDLVTFPAELAYWMMMCSHDRACTYLIEAYKKSSRCVFWGRRPTFENILMAIGNGLVQGHVDNFKMHAKPCTVYNCVPLGIETIRSPLRGIFLVTTNNKPPYCVAEP